MTTADKQVLRDKQTIQADCVSFKHKIADMIYGKAPIKELNFIIDRDEFEQALKDMKGGMPIFQTPEPRKQACHVSPGISIPNPILPNQIN